jgi:dTDP-4-amino-4,6-dideoxygalactose transaminase
MIDIHCHLLPAVDDGATSWEITLEMCRLAGQDGVTHMVATPHANYQYRYDRASHLALLDELRLRVPDMSFSLGCDFHLSYENIGDAMQHPERYAIGDTRYILVELSEYSAFKVAQTLYDLQTAGLVPIVTHPERNPLVLGKPDLLHEFAGVGCLFQITANSLTGFWGKASAAEILWEKGTDRARFRRGETDRYTWQAIGSSFAPSEITAAFLWAQLQHGETITERRCALWNRYHAAFEDLEKDGLVRRPEIPRECEHNGHLYRLLLPSAKAREETIAELGRAGIQAIFHYVPLHDSPAGLRYGRISGSLHVTENAAARLVRLPLHASLTEAEQAYIVEAVYHACRKSMVSL